MTPAEQMMMDMPKLLQAKRPTRLLRMIMNLVDRYTDFDDACQQACLGVMRAEKKFNPSYGVGFVTYAMYYVLASLQSGIRLAHKDSVIRTPRGVNDTLFTSHADVVGEGSSTELINIMTCEHDFDTVDHRDELDTLSKRVNQYDWSILRQRAEGLTLREIGQKRGLTRERVRQRELRTIHAVREVGLFG